VKLFLAEKRVENLGESTIYNYSVLLNRLVQFCGQQQPAVRDAKKVTPALIMKLRQQWVDSKMFTSVDTINGQLTALSMLFKWAHSVGYVKGNPTTPVKRIRKPKRKQHGAPAEGDRGRDDADRCRGR
jgi:site-specific recombinase XerD